MNTSVENIKNLVKEKFLNQEGSHDWHHIERVYNISIYLQEKEGGDKVVIQLAALLHDISDHKFNGGDWQAGSTIAKEIMLQEGISHEIAEKVAQVISQVSFKGALVNDEVETIEAKIVQDADRLDAIGAIGIARAFSYGGSKNRPLYDPEMEPILHSSKEEYTKSVSHTVNHFYEKLFLLKDLIKTESGKEIAEKRHLLMQQFINDFYDEWFFSASKK
jgi:uncharacterized protein